MDNKDNISYYEIILKDEKNHLVWCALNIKGVTLNIQEANLKMLWLEPIH